MVAVALFVAALLLVAFVGLATKWRSGAVARAVSLSLYLQSIALALALLPYVSFFTVLLLFGVVFLLGFLIEVIGVKSGIPFGRYHYTNALRPQLFKVPLQIGCAWWTVAIPALAIAARLRIPPLGQIATAALLMAAADIYIEHSFVTLNYWQWQKRGGIFGIPVTNSLGWFGTGCIVCFVLQLIAPLHLFASIPSIAWIYVAALILHTLACLFVWPGKSNIPLLLIGLLLLGLPLPFIYQTLF